MSSKFSLGATFAKLPAVCIKPRPNLPSAYVAGVPKALTAMAYWKDSAHAIDVADSFPIHYDASLPGWQGESGKTGLNLHLTIVIQLAADAYDFILKVRYDLNLLDDDSWHDVILEPPPPWNSGPLQHVHTPEIDENGIWVLD